MFKRFSICYILFMFYLTGISAQEDRWTGNATNLSKGNLRVNSSGRYLEYTDGTPFLYIGDTAWELISRLNDKETEQYLENRREKGFTVIQTVILDELDDMNVSSNGGPKLIDGIVQQRFLLSQFHYRILCHALQSPDYIPVYRTICPFCLCAARCRGVRRNYGISCHCFGGAGVVARNHLFCE